MDHFLLTSLIVLFASFTFSFAGFGFSMVAVSLLSLYLDTRSAVVFQYPYATLIATYLAFRAIKFISWSEVWPLLLGATVGLPFGLYFIENIPEAFLKKILGTFLVVFVIVSLLPLRSVFRRLVGKGRMSGVIFGLISGAFQGSYNTGGPPVVIYSLEAHDKKEKAKGVISCILAYMFLFLFPPYFMTGFLTISGLIYNAYYLPLMVVGTWFGGVLFKKVDNSLYRKSILLLLFVAALFLWIKS
jgi:uncharacterized membrane protein YfcA